MNATLLCPGPSLVNYKPVESAGIVIGVNRAATLHACDVWAATDRPLIDSVKPLGTPTLLTIEATRASFERRGTPWPYLVVTHCGMVGGKVDNGRHPWTRYTATAALYFAAWSGATRVDVWGCDWSGTKDWDGGTAERRTDERWADEQAIWQGVIDDTGIKVVRHT